MRWIILMGRLGMVLLVTGLALGLVSLFPSAPTGSSSSGSSFIPPEKYDILDSISTLTPQTGLRISVEANGSLQVYILNVFQGYLQDWTTSWVRERFPNLQDYEVWSASHNITVLNAFLESHSDVVFWKSDISNKILKDFFPTTVSNVTTILTNPSLSMVWHEYEVKSITSLAPQERILLSTQLLIPIGLVLTIPWLFFTKVRRTPL